MPSEFVETDVPADGLDGRQKAVIGVAEGDTLEDSGGRWTAAVDALVDLSLEATDAAKERGLPKADTPTLDAAP